MRVLFLGNSFTFFNDLPHMLSSLTGWETAMIARGAAYLHHFLDEKDDLNAQLNAALANGPWDYVVLQEQSFNAVGNRPDYQASARALCQRIRENGAQPVVYATWPYQPDTEKLESTHLTYDQMAASLRDSFEEACAQGRALLVPVGGAFERALLRTNLYLEDAYHPTPQGTFLAACVFADTLAPGLVWKDWKPEELSSEEAAGLRALALEGSEKR